MAVYTYEQAKDRAQEFKTALDALLKEYCDCIEAQWVETKIILDDAYEYVAVRIDDGFDDCELTVKSPKNIDEIIKAKQIVGNQK